MADFNLAIGKTLAREGGARVTEIANDKGGLTKYGICQATYPQVDIRNLTEQQAREIYKRDFWDRILGDSISSQLIAENIFDTAVNMGVRTASRLAQITLDITPADGIIGQASLQIINQQTEPVFIANFTLAKIARYAHICNQDKTQSKFLLGWINRALGGAA